MECADKRTVIMRKLFILLLLTAGIELHASTHAELRVGPHFPSSRLWKGIYGDVAPNVQFQISRTWCKPLEMWANADWVTKSGRSIGLKDPTQVNLLNISAGLNVLFPVYRKNIFYVGAGPAWGNIWLHNQSSLSGSEHVYRSVFGGVVKSGLYIPCGCRCYFDIYVDYLYEVIQFQTPVDLGGVKTGIGFGIRI